MRFDFGGMPRPLLHILTIFLSTSAVSAKPLAENIRGIDVAALFERSDCAVTCGWSGQLCCASGEACYTDSSNQAQCTSTAWAATTATAVTVTATAAAGGYWQMYTTTYVETDLLTVTSVLSTYVASATTTAWVATTSALTCDSTANEEQCGSICCASNQYCYSSGQCSAIPTGGSSGYATSYVTSTAGFSAPLRPTSSTLVVVTATSSPTTTVPFTAPVATGANITLTPTSAEHSAKLSGGAIAGIVIGVLLGLGLLFLICFYCCLKGIFDAILAIFGLGKRKRTRETTEYIEERHHSSYGGGAGRTWYGSKPARVERRQEKKSGGGNLLGVAAGLGGLAALLGLKRDRDRRRVEEKSEYGTASTYSDYYTSESSASSDDRRTRDTRRSSRR